MSATTTQTPVRAPGTSRLATGIAVSITILVLLAVVTELASIAILTVIKSQPAGRLQHSYYRDKPWAADLWKETALASRTHYRAYVVWKRSPFAGKYVNIEGSGLRHTVNPACGPGARQIWMFGSSTLWGTGATDEQTVASILSQEYASSSGPVCVTNFGEAGWTSTQSIIQLELALKTAPRPPDQVIFDDGFGDVFAVYESGKPDVHMDFDTIRATLEAGLHKSEFAYWKETGTYRLISLMMNKLAQMKSAPAPSLAPARKTDDLAEMAVQNYIGNLKLLDALAAKYGFPYTAFWGPALCAGHKPLSGPERALMAAARPGLPELCRETYARMFAKPLPHLVDLSDTFDQTPADTYLDMAHVSPDGNRTIALRMLDVLRKSGRESMSKP
jgi:hypothetical protein